jgi:DNA mismatch endonuclease (patch repair protein)
MADMFSQGQRSAITGRIRSHGNLTTELRFIALLRRREMRGWRRGIALEGRPDFVFRAVKMAVFIYGDFWLGNPKLSRVPKTNAEYWIKKIARNPARDRLGTALYAREAGRSFAFRNLIFRTRDGSTAGYRNRF